VVAWGEGWHPGVLGIVASRLSDRHGLPAVVLRVEGEEAHGSARGVDGVHLVEALGAVGHLLVRHGGHRQAAGLALRRDRLDDFRDAFLRHGAPRPAGPALPAADAEVSLADVGDPLLAEWERLRPFGAGNEEPLLSARGLTVVRRSPMGAGGLHARLLVSGGGVEREVTAFNRPDGVASEGESVDLLFTPYEDRWRGRRELRLALKASRRAEAGRAGGAAGA
jgi:single-stranded-DNA-specific exonuclease